MTVTDMTAIYLIMLASLFTILACIMSLMILNGHYDDDDNEPDEDETKEE